jgi:hypothetical protein
MQNKVVYVMIAGLATGLLSTLSPNAVAGDKAYFAVLSPEAVMPGRLDTVSRTIETTTSYPVVIEKAGTTTTVLETARLMPVMIERTTVAKPHHLPFSFGVWP